MERDFHGGGRAFLLNFNVKSDRVKKQTWDLFSKEELKEKS